MLAFVWKQKKYGHTVFKTLAAERKNVGKSPVRGDGAAAVGFDVPGKAFLARPIGQGHLPKCA